VCVELGLGSPSKEARVSKKHWFNSLWFQVASVVAVIAYWAVLSQTLHKIVERAVSGHTTYGTPF
jgi:hypothetical protein